ncbi:MAG: dTMP kinase [Ilumatobacteraceae bacterium]
MTTPGRYIAFEGPEGCGKSTHARRLAEVLDGVATREHGGTRIGLMIRGIVADPANVELTDKAEALLIAADRAQHLAEVVEPALAAGRHVVSDRSVFSALAYQGYGRGLPLETVRSVNEWAIGGRWPELVILLDVPAEQLAHRMRSRDLDRFEQAADGFHERVADGFRQMAAEDSDRWVVIPADRDREATATAIRRAVQDRLGI